jgi:hypothetical protein
MSPQIKNSVFGLYRYFKVASNPERNCSKSPTQPFEAEARLNNI